jgi:hypothetical protein
MKTKYILLLVLTLVVGFLIGSLTTGRVTRSKVDRIKSWNTREGFREHLFGIMQATESQKVQLSPMLDSFSDLHWELMKRNWESQKLLFDSMDSLIKPLIDEQQFQLLMEHKQKIRKGRENKDRQRCKQDNSKSD